MGSLLEISLNTPTAGAALDANPRAVSRDAAMRLENLRVDRGFARSRFGYTTLNGAAFDSKRVIDIFDRTFADGTGETTRHTRDTTQRSVAGAWSAVTLDAAWTGPDTSRFWCAAIPFGAETKGRLAYGNGVDILKTWTGGAGTMTAYPGGFASRFAIVGDDNRLFLGYTTEGGNPYSQRVRWTVIGLVNGGATDWTGTGSGALDLRSDPWPITGFWKQGGRIYVGKSRGICVLTPTGISTDAYGYETLQTNGEGLFAPGSLVQFGNLVAFVTHLGITVFDGVSLTPILGLNQRNFIQRLNATALNQITVAFDTHNNRVGWGLPLDGATTPTEIWWYEATTGHWEIDTVPHSAISLYSSVNTTTIDSLAGTIDALAGTIDSLSGTGVNEPILIIGTNAGATYQFNNSATTDIGNAIPSIYASPALVPLGQTVSLAGRQHEVTEDDYLVVDGVSVRFLDRGDAYTAQAEVSGDGGANWTLIGTAAISPGGGTDNYPRLARAVMRARQPVKDAVQVRLANNTPGARWGWADLTVYLDIVGRKRP